MEEKRLLLRQIGWTEELIDKCLAPSVTPEVALEENVTHFPGVFEEDMSNINVKIETPFITDGAHIV
jgi:hypothetical protein